MLPFSCSIFKVYEENSGIDSQRNKWDGFE